MWCNLSQLLYLLLRLYKNLSFFDACKHDIWSSKREQTFSLYSPIHQKTIACKYHFFGGFPVSCSCYHGYAHTHLFGSYGMQVWLTIAADHGTYHVIPATRLHT